MLTTKTQTLTRAIALFAIASFATLAHAQDNTKSAAANAPAKPTQPVQYWFGVAVENIPPSVAKHIHLTGDQKLAPDQGLMVLEVIPNSPASKAGLKVEDLLCSVDDQPLTSQEDLARAANTIEPLTVGKESAKIAIPLIKPRKFTYLREGDVKTISIAPEPRPDSMIVTGPRLDNFAANTANRQAGGNGSTGQRNIVMPNGDLINAGPGYRVNLNDASTVTVQSIKQLVNNGDTIVLVQDADAQGNVSNSITVGNKRYPVDAARIKDLPENIQPLARQLVESGNAQSTQPVTQARPTPVEHATPSNNPELEKRLSDLEKQNEDLRKQNEETQNKLNQVLDLLNKQK